MRDLQEIPSFHSDATSAVGALRRALGEMVACLPGEIRRPADLQHGMGLDYKLCWQIINILRATDPLSVAHHVPGVLSAKRLLAAARGKGISQTIVEDIETSLRQFNEMVNEHARDRPAFDAMVASITGGEAVESITLQQRRSAYRSESQIWGSELQMCLLQGFFRRSATGAGADECIVNSKYGLRRMRPRIQLPIRGHRQFTATEVVKRNSIRPLEPESEALHGAPLLKDYCSQPLPAFNTTQLKNGWVRTTLDSEEIGRKSAINLTFGTVTHNVPISTDDDGRKIIHNGLASLVPTEMLVIEAFVHRASFGRVQPKVAVQSTSPDDDVSEILRGAQPFMIHERVASLGSAADLIPSMDFPRYPNLVRHVFHCLDWNPPEFDVYRIQIPYPILHTMTHLWFAFEE